MRKNRSKILVAMSGGVDSSVAAALLVRAGYEVVGAFMKQWDDGGVRSSTAKAGQAEFGVRSVCPWKQDRRDAMRVAAHLGIELITLDFEKEYKELVTSYMFREYEAGRTPNPDVLCNTYIKFGAWLNKAREMGFQYLATGHYAHLGREFRISSAGWRIEFQNTLKRAKDNNKDQTYFLHQLNQEQLQHALFPIGHLLKSEVRKLARKFGLPTADREESMGICFVGEVPMKEFLQQKIKPMSGNVVLSSGEIVGQHEGLAFYTIGQRHGLQTRDRRPSTVESSPLFVVEKRFETNELVVGFENDPFLFKKEISVTDIHWISGRPPKFPLECRVRLRHRQELQEAMVRDRRLELVPTVASGIGDQTLILSFATPQRAPTPGQFAVFYKKNVCLGGGVIE